MPEAAITEFWKDLKPIQKVFQLDALPEVYSQNAPGGDERLFVPFTETVSSKPLWISPGQQTIEHSLVGEQPIDLVQLVFVSGKFVNCRRNFQA